ncbi:MAG: tmk [Actinomycetia bacterium]|nr:tmk [Actinomycetes bacterium]
MTLVDVVRRRGYRTLLIGQGVSALGDWMGTFAFIAVVSNESGSSTAVGGILALRLVPAALGAPLAARAAGKWDRRKTMVAMDLVRAGMIAVVPLVRALWWIYLWAFLLEVASIVFLPARDSSIPDLVDEDDLPVANGLVLGSSYGTIPLGAAAFAAAAALPGADLFGRPYALVFWIDGLTFVVSALMIMRLTQLGRATASASASASAPAEHDVRFRDAFRLPLVRAVLPATISVAFGLGALFSLGIRFVRDVMHASDAQFGVLVALFGVGASVGLGLLQMRRPADELSATRAGVAALGIIVGAFSLAPALGFAFLGAAAFGAAAAWTLASGMAALQSQLDGRERVLAFTVFHVVIRSGLAVAAIGAGLAGDVVSSVHWPVVGTLEGTRLVLLCSGVLVFLASARVSLREPQR